MHGTFTRWFLLCSAWCAQNVCRRLELLAGRQLYTLMTHSPQSRLSLLACGALTQEKGGPGDTWFRLASRTSRYASGQFPLRDAPARNHGSFVHENSLLAHSRKLATVWSWLTKKFIKRVYRLISWYKLLDLPLFFRLILLGNDFFW